MNASDALSAVKTIYSIISKRLLKRSLGDRTWNRSEIASEIARLNEDLKNYLSVHTIQALDIMQSQQYARLSANMEEITIKLAELDLRFRPRGGDSWPTNIVAQAQANQAEAGQQPMDITGTEGLPFDELPLRSITEPARTQITIHGLKTPFETLEHTIVLDLKIDNSYDELLQLITDAGYIRPDSLNEERELQITVVDGDSSYDGTLPGGLQLQISRSEPLRWWYNKYTEYHGTAPASTPGQTVAEVDLIQGGIWAGGVHFQFHRTLRVPDTVHQAGSQLPPDLGQFPLLPLSGLDTTRLPIGLRNKGGFLMEALWLSFANASGFLGSAVKASVGGVNAISGVVNTAITPLTVEQDYLVTGWQTRLDGIVTGPGIVRQFVATTLGHGYTVEEQVTGKADEGGLQFDIFCPRPSPGGFRLESTGRYLDDLKTPQELGLSVENQLRFRTYASTLMLILYSHRLSFDRAVRPSASPEGGLRETIVVVYLPPLASAQVIFQGFFLSDDSDRQGLASLPVAASLKEYSGWVIWVFPQRTSYGAQMYDEEHGHRLYVHIVSPRMWEVTKAIFNNSTLTSFGQDITGSPLPISPITREMYHRHNVPWFPLYDDPEAHVGTVSVVLAGVKSVAQLDGERTGIVGSMFNPNQSSSDRPQEIINFAHDRVSPLHIAPACDPNSAPQNKRQRRDSDASQKPTKYQKTM
ncbi:hypothetical protein C8R44DRAFT_739177 [Mycena epipterygia]|nr:hypothetical protein C8R44DRAFT_739177 [Mycena epipterygia]